MGNTVKVRLKEDRNDLEITEALVQEFQDHINLVDHSMEGLAKSVDSMKAACELLLSQPDNKEPPSQDSIAADDKDRVTVVQRARHLLETIDSSVSDHKFVVMESLSKLFHFVVDVGRSYTILTEDCPLAFLIDKYRTDNTVDDVEDGLMYYDARIGSLQKEIKRLQDIYSIAKREIKILNEREILYRDEIKQLEMKAESQEKRIEEKFANERMTALTSNHTLNSELKEEQRVDEMFDRDTGMVKVFHNRSGNLNATKEANENQMIIEKLRNQNASLNQEMETRHKDMITAKNVTEDTLKRKCKEIDDLNQEIQNLRYKNVRKAQPAVDAVDKSSSTEEFDELSKENNSLETKLKEEICSLKRELTLKNSKVLQGLEKQDYLRRYETAACAVKMDVCQSLQREMSACNVDLKITPWSPSKPVGKLTDKVIIAPIIIKYSGEMKQRIHRTIKELQAPLNIVAILVLYDADNRLVCQEMEEPDGEEFKELGGVFKFAFSYYMQKSHTESNEDNFNPFLQFLKYKVSEDRYLSR